MAKANLVFTKSNEDKMHLFSFMVQMILKTETQTITKHKGETKLQMF